MDCKFCEKSFSKGEHLRRHERSHTGSRPYVCKSCKRPFARQDSLMRHEKLHNRKQFEEFTPSPSSMHSASTTNTPRSLSAVDEEPDHITIEMRDRIQDQIWSQPHSTASNVTEAEFDLIWPDTEDLFQTIMSSDSANAWQMPLGTLPFIGELDQMNNFMFGQGNTLYTPGSTIDPIPAQPSMESHQAVRDVSQMVTNLSSIVTAAAKAPSITSVFLDECLHMFFERFIPTFPVLHRATFVFRKCTHPLLLNAIAIGSLYLGPKASIAKGEAMWRLAHMAVATNWEALITHRGPYDACNGVQLVLTALLGQVYGALSKNKAVRTTSQAFHAHGFFWARQCGMFDTKPFSIDEIPSSDASDAEIDHQWRVWAAKEIQQRALLGNYILDGLITRMSGDVASVRHTANPLGLSSNEILFEARTSQEWLSRLQSQPLPNPQGSFRGIFRSLFQLPNNNFLSLHSCSAFSFRVILEGLQSLVSDCDNDDLAIVGVPTKTELRRALIEVHSCIKQSTYIPLSDRLELFLRWHAICLDACVDSSLLCRSICSRYKVNQNIYGGGAGRTDLDLASWANTEEARRALLHAVSIQEIVEQLPRGRAHVIHIPSSLFVAAAVYSVFSLAGLTTMNIPSPIDWTDVLAANNDPCVILAELSTSNVLSESKRYLYGAGRWSDAVDGDGRSLNLFYELNSMQKLFRCLSSQWGIAFDMEEVLDAWITLCH